MSAEATGFVWKHSPLRGAGLLVHLAIADVVNDTYGNEFWMTVGNLADKARVNRDSARGALRTLEAEGWIETLEERSNAPTRYRFLFPEVAAQPRPVAAQPRAGSRPSRGQSRPSREITQENPTGTQGDPNHHAVAALGGEVPADVSRETSVVVASEPTAADRAHEFVTKAWDARLAAGKTAPVLASGKKGNAFVALRQIATALIEAGHEPRAVGLAIFHNDGAWTTNALLEQMRRLRPDGGRPERDSPSKQVARVAAVMNGGGAPPQVQRMAELMQGGAS